MTFILNQTPANGKETRKGVDRIEEEHLTDTFSSMADNLQIDAYLLYKANARWKILEKFHV